MEFTAFIAETAILTAAVLLWARWSKLDLGLRAPVFRGAWPWMALYSAWIVVELVINELDPIEVDQEWAEWLQQLSLVEELAVTVVLGPVFEELLFRGAMFAALLRRWGIWVAVIVPSVLWGLLHVQYEAWYMASIGASGILLAMARWKSGSLYVPLALHALFNLLDMILAYPPFAPLQ